MRSAPAGAGALGLTSAIAPGVERGHTTLTEFYTDRYRSNTISVPIAPPQSELNVEERDGAVTFSHTPSREV
jgi:hypothetical protein